MCLGRGEIYMYEAKKGGEASEANRGRGGLLKRRGKNHRREGEGGIEVSIEGGSIVFAFERNKAI